MAQLLHQFRGWAKVPMKPNSALLLVLGHFSAILSAQKDMAQYSLAASLAWSISGAKDVPFPAGPFPTRAVIFVDNLNNDTCPLEDML